MPLAISSRVMSIVPSTGIVGPVQIGCEPITSTNGVSNITETALVQRADQIGPAPLRRRTQRGDEEHRADERDHPGLRDEQRGDGEGCEQRGGGRGTHGATP